MKPDDILALVKVAETDAGIDFLRYLMNDKCGFHGFSIVANETTGEINVQSTVYMEARRNVWVELRKHIPHDRLVLIENPPPRPALTEEQIKWQTKQEQERLQQMPGHSTAKRKQPLRS